MAVKQNQPRRLRFLTQGNQLMRTLQRVNCVVHKGQVGERYGGFKVRHRAWVARQNPFSGNMVPTLLHTLTDASQQTLRIAQRHDIQHHAET